MTKKKEGKDNPYKKNGKEWYKDKVMDYVCEQIASSSLGLQRILDNSPIQLPSRKTIMEWLADEENKLSDRYARAHEEQAEFLGGEILDISDNQVGSPIMVDGNPLLDSNNKPIMIIDAPAVAHAKLRTENRRWLMGKLKSKKYGEKIQQEITAPEGVTFNMGFAGKPE